jgi:exodeoxyribonuclease V alpha subunit
MSLAVPSTGRGAFDPFDPRTARQARGVLRDFNAVGVLSAADVHVAGLLVALGGVGGPDETGDDEVALAVALTVRATRLGHVCIDLSTTRDTTTTDAELPVDVGVLPWPDPDRWVRRLAASPLVGLGDDAPPDRPLRLNGKRLYLDRYWRQERAVADDLRTRSETGAQAVAFDCLVAGLERLFGGPPPDLQRLASATAVLRRFSVIAGGPGTGKTTTVARMLALLDEQAVALNIPPPRVALAAPTGKAAARLEEAVHAEASVLPIDGPTRDRLVALSASTLHRLLGWRPDSRSRFRHDHTNRLPHDVVVVDETSMVSLSLMAKLIDALRGDTRLILVGDPEQLASVEAGAVLGDIVGPAGRGLRITGPTRAKLALATGQPVTATEPPVNTHVGDGIIVLRRVHRFGGAIEQLATAIHDGDGSRAMELLRSGGEEVRWIDADVGEADTNTDTEGPIAPVRRLVVTGGRALTAAARGGDRRRARQILESLRVLCAHRRGPYGVTTWTATIERWLAAAIDGYAAEGPWYLGRPLLVTENDYELQLYNGDIGVVAATPGGRVSAIFERRGELVEINPTRLGAVETLHAMTVHKSQGSQFDRIILILPEAASPILTRQLLYTAVSRARLQVTVVGPQDSVQAAIARPISRASGLGERLWGSDPLR